MLIDKYITQVLNNFPKSDNIWKYEDGCVLIGCANLYQATKEERYKQFVLDYLDQFIAEDGTIKGYDISKYNLDNINSGKVLFNAYSRTGEEKYKNAIEVLMEQIRKQPRTKSGSFWHKAIYPDQVWLDGLYMALPFYMMYETKFNDMKNYNDIIDQFVAARKFLFDREKELYYHGCDESKTIFWADKETGRSANFWIRALGWYLMALTDVLSEMNEMVFEQYVILEELLREGVKGILKYQDPASKMFYQVIDHPEVLGNYLETSGSTMISYAILKGCSLGVLLKEKYLSSGVEIFESIVKNRLREEDGIIKLTGICSVAGLGPESDTRRDGSILYYLSEPIVEDDRKGIGALMMTYAQIKMLHK